MAFNYVNTATTADRLIKKFGALVTLSRTSEPAYDPATGTTTGGTVQTWTATAVTLPASQGTVEAFDQRFVGGTLIESNLRSLLIAAKGLPYSPRPGDTVTFADGRVAMLLGNTPLAPDGVTQIIHQCTARF